MSEPVRDTEPEYIWVLGLEDDTDEETDGTGDRAVRWFGREDVRVGRNKVPTAELERQVEGFVASVANILKGIPQALGGFAVQEVTVSAEVSAKGTVSLLGTGGELLAPVA